MRQPKPDTSSHQSQQQTLAQQLPYQINTTGAQGQTCGNFSTTGHGASQKKIGHIGTGNEQYHPCDRQEHQRCDPGGAALLASQASIATGCEHGSSLTTFSIEMGKVLFQLR